MSTCATHILAVHLWGRSGLTLPLTWSPDESRLGRRQQELEQRRAEVRRAVAGRDEAEHNLQLTQAHLGECRVHLEEVSSELLRQQERSDRGEPSALANLGKCRLWPFFLSKNITYLHLINP